MEFDSDNDELRYFLLSIAWRTLQYELENDKFGLVDYLDEDELALTKNIAEKWRAWLSEKDMDNIRMTQMFLIPTAGLSFFEKMKTRIWNNIGMDFFACDKNDPNELAYIIVQVPYFIFVIMVWGEINDMDSYLVGRKIKTGNDALSKYLNDTLEKFHIEEFEKMNAKITDVERKAIIRRFKKQKKY